MVPRLILINGCELTSAKSNVFSHLFHTCLNKCVNYFSVILWQKKIAGNSKNAEENLAEQKLRNWAYVLQILNMDATAG